MKSTTMLKKIMLIMFFLGALGKNLSFQGINDSSLKKETMTDEQKKEIIEEQKKIIKKAILKSFSEDCAKIKGCNILNDVKEIINKYKEINHEKHFKLLNTYDYHSSMSDDIDTDLSFSFCFNVAVEKNKGVLNNPFKIKNYKVGISENKEV